MNGAWRAQTLGEVLASAAGRAGAADALVTQAERTSYCELERAAWRAAAALHAAGIRRGERIGLLLGNGLPWLAAFYGAALLGAVTVPLNTRWKAAELAFCLRQSECAALLAADRFLKLDFVSLLREAEPAIDAALPGAQLPQLRRLFVLGADVPPAAQSWQACCAAAGETAALREAAAAVAPADLLLIQFTSGTTARPKGAMLTHEGMLRNAAAVAQRMGVRSDDRYFNCRPFFHVAGSTLSALVALCAGAALVTLPTFEAGAALRMMEAERCTLTSGNDTIFQLLLGHPERPARRLALRGGWAAADPETLRRIAHELGAREICAAYGLSECSPNVVFSDWREPLELRLAALALPHEGVELRIADPRTLAPLPPETPGEIQVRGWNVMRGYCGNPEASAAAFTPDGWLRTGDLGALRADGRLRMTGRMKDVFRVGGENVAPAEVEAALLEHPALASAQVIGVPDARLGEVAAAFVVLRPGARASEAELLEWARPRMAGFRVPRYLRIVADFEAIGMTASGKVQKHALREHALREFGLCAR